MALPVINMKKSELPLMLLAAAALLMASLAGRYLTPAAQDDSSNPTRYHYIYAIVAVTTFASLLLLVLSAVKGLFGHGHFIEGWPFNLVVSQDGYQPIGQDWAAPRRQEDSKPPLQMDSMVHVPVHATAPPEHHADRQHNRQHNFDHHIHQNNTHPHAHLQADVQTQRPQEFQRGNTKPHSMSMSASYDGGAVSAGIIIEREALPFMHCGVSHNGGLFRVARVVQDSPCDRQGAAEVGDVIISVNQVELGPLLETEAARLLHGPAGSTIVIRMFSGPGRVPFDRHVVLAPSPSSLRWSSGVASHQGRQAHGEVQAPPHVSAEPHMSADSEPRMSKGVSDFVLQKLSDSYQHAKERHQ